MSVAPSASETVRLYVSVVPLPDVGESETIVGAVPCADSAQASMSVRAACFIVVSCPFFDGDCRVYLLGRGYVPAQSASVIIAWPD